MGKGKGLVTVIRSTCSCRLYSGSGQLYKTIRGRQLCHEVEVVGRSCTVKTKVTFCVLRTEADILKFDW